MTGSEVILLLKILAPFALMFLFFWSELKYEWFSKMVNPKEHARHKRHSRNFQQAVGFYAELLAKRHVAEYDRLTKGKTMEKRDEILERGRRGRVAVH